MDNGVPVELQCVSWNSSVDPGTPVWMLNPETPVWILVFYYGSWVSRVDSVISVRIQFECWESSADPGFAMWIPVFWLGS